MAEPTRIKERSREAARALLGRTGRAAQRLGRTADVGVEMVRRASHRSTAARARLTELGGVVGAAQAWVAGDVSLRQEALNAQDEVRRLYRLARADAELGEAYRVFQQHEQRITAWRAQGVVFLKVLEREAELTLAGLPEWRREQLAEVARQIREAGLTGGTHTRGDAQCGQCVRKLAPAIRGGDCCGGMVFLGWDQVDATFRVLLGEYAPVVHEFNGDPTRCGFLTEQGCRLPPGTRPTVCTAYYCDPYKADLKRDGRWEALAKDLMALNDGRRQMNFRLNLAKRFLLQQNQAEGYTHPMDFVWDRLRLSGAEISATGKRQTGGSTRLPLAP